MEWWIVFIGVLFVKLICPPHFDKFKKKELGILIIYSQVSELIVKLISTSSIGWEYNVYWWNPLLFVFNGHNITLLPQLIWLAAPIVYFFLIIRFRSKFSD